MFDYTTNYNYNPNLCNLEIDLTAGAARPSSGAIGSQNPAPSTGKLYCWHIYFSKYLFIQEQSIHTSRCNRIDYILSCEAAKGRCYIWNKIILPKTSKREKTLTTFEARQSRLLFQQDHWCLEPISLCVLIQKDPHRHVRRKREEQSLKQAWEAGQCMKRWLLHFS